MTDRPASLPLQNLSRRRLADLLKLLAQQGLTQQQVASRANLPPQYLSDLKCGRRPMTELVARRLGEEFDINHHWLLGTSNTMEPPESRSGHSAARPDDNWLPVLNIPIDGEPRAYLAWDRTMVELSGAVADMLVQAQSPYALRFGHNDVKGRLRKRPCADFAVGITRCGNLCCPIEEQAFSRSTRRGCVGAGCQRERFAKHLPRGGTLRRNSLGLTVYSPKGLSDRRMPTPASLAKFNVKTGGSTRSRCVSSRPMAHGVRYTVAARQRAGEVFLRSVGKCHRFIG